ncbi:hypothetical protein EB1_25170 [Empedobacter brevis NBRC 14943 = ATCC 43319]|uniref:Uncharacterized protein n=1 Tax=Empedobacter brevis NBRC 14943 = ATCC 43319 TaxID=1218108 RepID=A0A511NJ61_9FLAO|nr:hypothetical protein [Empedobacter brevis]GEM52727.1 hypothetical protein EB1_25170 [Empedobacter brevis NBRC 14943 = ATCC 43319]
MKKFIFSAIACVVFAGGLLVSNDNSSINTNLVNNPNTKFQFSFQDTDVIAESNTVADYSDPKRPCII